MSVRELMNKSPAAVTIGAIVLLALALGLIILRFGGLDRKVLSDQVYFIDQNTGKIFLASRAAAAPIDAESGPYQGQPAGVKVTIMSCGGCADFNGMTAEQVAANGAWVAWLEQYTPQMRKRIAESGHTTTTTLTKSGVLIRGLDDEKWVDYGSGEGEAVIQKNDRCPDGGVVICEPGS